MTEKEREKYLATECFHPRKVTNRYTHETLFVRCGTCPSCLVHRSNIQCALISNMSSHFKYAYFFTLTYSDEFVPRVSLEVVERCEETDKNPLFLKNREHDRSRERENSQNGVNK